MISSIVSVGDKLELKRIRTIDNDKEDKIYKSKLLDFISDDKASIAMPIEKGRVIPLEVGDKYSIRFFTNKGLFQCKAVITERYRNDNIYVLIVQFLSDLEKYQRRQYYRLECILDVTYHIITDVELSLMNKIQADEFQNEEEKQKYINTLEEFQSNWLTANVLDLSGGGARFTSNSNHESGLLIQISMRLGIDKWAKNYLLNAVIISSNKMTNRQGYYEHRVQFKDIKKDEREAIIKFIFEEERRQRKKEKG
jgi:c-di-GMP-binding flagellar brake protein YcgR